MKEESPRLDRTKFKASSIKETPIVYMKEIEDQIRIILEKMDRLSEKVEDLNEKVNYLLEALTSQNRTPLGPR